MHPAFLFSLTGLILFGMGLHALFVAWHPLRKIIAANIMCSGVFLIFIAGNAGRQGGADPLPQALVLTGIVIAVSTTALALALACSILGGRREESGPEDADKGRGA
ncbi:cation:proton antiporter subunit C [Thiovibrio sp. JS02]